MGAAVLVIDPAPGLGRFVVVIHAPVHNGGGGGDDPRLQGRHGGTGLEGGARGVCAADGPVQQGSAHGVADQLAVILVKGGQVIGGIAGHGQHLAGANPHHHRRAAPDDAVLGGHGLNGLGQGLLRVLLHIDVQGQGHGAAGLRLLGVKLAGDLPLLVGGDDPGALGAVEIGLKGLLRALPAHQGVHGVALHVPIAGDAVFRVAHPVLVVDGAQPPQHMGGIFGVIYPGGGGTGGYPLILAVRRLADELHGHVVGKDVLCVRQTLHRQLIPHPGDGPGLVVGIAAVDFEQLPQLGHEPVRLQGGGHLGQLGIGDALVLQEQGEALAVLGVGIAVGRGFAQGQGIVPNGVVLGAQVRQPQDGGVQVLVILKILGGEDQGIGQPVGHQHLAVAVGDDPPGGLHRLAGGVAGQGLGPVFLPVKDLGIVHHPGEGQQAQAHQPRQRPDAGPHRVKCVFLHGTPPISGSGCARCAAADTPAATAPPSRPAPAPSATGRRSAPPPAGRSAAPCAAGP